MTEGRLDIPDDLSPDAYLALRDLVPEGSTAWYAYDLMARATRRPGSPPPRLHATATFRCSCGQTYEMSSE